MFSQSQVQVSSQSLDDAVGNSSGVRRELADGIRSLPRVCQKLAEGDRELAKMTQGSSLEEDRETHQKIIEGSRKACRELGRRGKGVILLREIVYPCIPDPNGEYEEGQASSLAVSTRWISTAKLLQSGVVTLAQREGGE
ncbi:hypothetical protein BHM03_00014532 [Ensete ventricosum]|nr:hypothetical protein BHM03_00014532 [Ensete ventricosum]